MIYRRIICSIKAALIIVLNLINFNISSQTTIIFQPGAIDGKDVTVNSYYPDSSFYYVNTIDNEAHSQSGTDFYKRNFFEFDLSQLPPNINVVSAKLSLFYSPQTDGGTHETLSGSNACLLQRVISFWDENSVTWNNQPVSTDINKVEVPMSTYDTQDYPDIDVTSLVQDMYDDPGSSFGFCMKLKTEQKYRRLVFASSDHNDPEKHPRLEITFLLSDTVQPVQKCNIDVPSAFSPNGDGQNDMLFVRGSDFEDFEFRLFNRWGEQVFSTKDVNNAWDGTYKGVKQESEVYYYTLKANCIYGDKIEKRGNITLLY